MTPPEPAFHAVLVSDEHPNLADFLNDNAGVVGAGAGYAVNRSVQNANRNIEKLQKEIGSIQREMAKKRRQEEQEQRDRERVFQIGVQIDEICASGVSPNAFLRLENLANSFEKMNLSTAAFRQLQDKELLNSTKLRLQQARQRMQDDISQETTRDLIALRSWHQFASYLKQSLQVEQDVASAESELDAAEARVPYEKPKEIGVFAFFVRKQVELTKEWYTGRKSSSGFVAHPHSRGFVFGAEGSANLRKLDEKPGGMIGFALYGGNRKARLCLSLAVALALIGVVLLVVGLASVSPPAKGQFQTGADHQGVLVLSALIVFGMASAPFTVVLQQWSDMRDKENLKRSSALKAVESIKAKRDNLRDLKSQLSEKMFNCSSIPFDLRRHLCDSAITYRDREAKASEVFAYTEALKRSLVVEDKHLAVDS